MNFTPKSVFKKSAQEYKKKLKYIYRKNGLDCDVIQAMIYI